MTTSTAAAANSTRTLSLDFTSKPAAAASTDSHEFASRLNDAQQSAAKPEPTPAAHEVAAKKPAERPKATDDVDEQVESSANPAAKALKKPKDAQAADEVEDGESANAEPSVAKPAAAKQSDDALLAALAAAATPAAKAVVNTDDAKPADAAAADPATTPDVAVAAAAVAAGGVAQANVAGVAADAPTPTTDAKSKAVVATDATPVKEADAKLDALTAKLKPVDEKTAALPPEATEQHAGGESKQHGSQQQQQPSPGDRSQAIAPTSEATPAARADAPKDQTFDDLLSKLAVGDAPPIREPAAPPATPATPLRPEQQFAKDNVDRVVTSVQSQVNAGGNGTMHVRLDPPELGALDVAAKMLDGKMSVSFTTSNEQATQLLSHSLSQLKTSLESAGISVDRIEVRQAASTQAGASADRDSSNSQHQQGKGFDAPSQQQGEQQRKQMVEKLWRKYAYGSDAVDVVA